MDNTDLEIKAGQLPESFYKKNLESGPGCLIIIDPSDYRIVFANRLFTETLGYTPEDIYAPGFSFLDIIGGLQKEWLDNHLHNVLSSVPARYKYCVYKLRSKEGGNAPFYVYSSPVIYEDDTAMPYYHLMMLPDLSLWPIPFISFDTREMFLEQFSNEGFGTFEWIIGADKVFWSDGIYKIYEVDDKEAHINYELVKNFTHPDTKDASTAAIMHAIQTGGNVNVESKIVTARNNIRIINTVGKVLKDENDKPLKVVGSVRDITHQRLVEDDLKKMVTDLNQSNHELEDFAYVASHDLQEPLRKIATFGERLAAKYQDMLTGEGAMYLERILAASENMRVLINNLLEFSRITRGTQPFSAVNLNFIVHQVKGDLELVIEESGAIINNKDLPVIDASITLMKQLFMNIVTNAIKFRNPSVPPVITITSAELSHNEKLKCYLPPAIVYYRITIADNGIGFESEYAERIFQIFQRLHGKTDYPGSGIGLAICKKIAEYHKGTIYAESTPGQGSRFNILLPQRQPEQNEMI
ncbi:MAG: PAS domain-containing protein [Taibaiella sp.]|nr:PAS domain-containing protein [Taibaiella sp.]